MGNYETEFAALNQAQKQAVTTIEGPVLVIAGPGTGKTQLLSVRIAHILKTTDTLPQNILCLTFTESAAHTMRQRLVNLIGQAAYDVTISTYHAFGSELIRRYPDFFSTEMPDARPIDDLGMDQILRKIIKALPYGNPLKFADAYIFDIKSLISDYKRALLEPEDIRNIAKQNELFIQRTTPIVQECLAVVNRIDKRSVAAFSELYDITSKKQQSEQIDGIVPLANLWIRELGQALQECEETGKTTTLTAWKNAWLAKDENGKFVVDGVHTIAKLYASADIYEKYRDTLKKHNLYDYDDMILKAIRGLEKHSDLKYTLQEQYLYLLLDEFQDTNAAQLRLVELLTDNPVNEDRPNVLAVGDDDQAIYAFQGADYSHMLAFHRNYRDVLVIPLRENYRSHHEILQMAAGIAGQINTRLHYNFPNIEKNIVAKKADLPKQSVLERHEFKSDLAQFVWVAKKIKQLIAEGMQPNSIAVLAPEHKHLEPLVPYLQQESISVRYDKRENILDDPAVSELLQMARLVEALSMQNEALSASLWPEVLSFEFWGLETEEIWNLSWKSYDTKTSWTNMLLTTPKTEHIALFFIRLSLIASHETVELLLDYLIGSEPLHLHEKDAKPYRSPFYQYYFGKERQQTEGSSFWSLLSNLTVLRQHLREYRAADTDPLTIGDLLEFVEAHRQANIKILNTSPYHESSDAVEIMTAYKAKGQEFAAVFVLACLDEVWGSKHRGGSSKVPLPQNLQFIRYGGANEDERLRLFYVALTRAKTNLYLTSYENNFAKKTMSHLKFLGETEENKSITSPLLPEGRQVVHLDDGNPPAVHELSTFWQNRHVANSRAVSLKALLSNRLERYQLAPTHLNAFTDVMYGGPQQFFIDTLLRFPRAPMIEGIYGDAFHKTIQYMHIHQVSSGSLPSTKQIQQTFESIIVSQRVATDIKDQLLQRGRKALMDFYQQKKDSFFPDHLHERNFREEGSFIEEAHLTGNIDKLVINNTDKTITLIDFKTGKSHAKWLTNDVKLHKYRQQLYLYKILVESSHSFKDYKVTDAFLQFVEPNESGEIVDLHLHFNETEEQRIRQLVQAVWKRITELDFPDITHFPPSTKGIIAFEDSLLKK